MSGSESSSILDESSYSCLEYEIEDECSENTRKNESEPTYATEDEFSLEPLADDSWVEQYLRRKFTRLIHGRLEEKRKSLPACAYHAIRTAFSEDGDFTGYEDLQ